MMPFYGCTCKDGLADGFPHLPDLGPAVHAVIQPGLLIYDEGICTVHAGTGQVHGLDIGCGCNLVYPLIGASRFGWNFTAVDNDDVAITSANSILASNSHLKSLITLRCSSYVVQTNQTVNADRKEEEISNNQCGALACAAGSQSFDFCVCNPPFFAQASESCQGPAAYGGSASEMVCEGGEHVFVETMISDSLVMHTRGEGTCHWYTVMLGKKSTFRAMRKVVNGMQPVTAVRTKELVQGKHSRWVLGWSFSVPRGHAYMPLR